MSKYLLKRILHGIVSVVIVVAIVMLLVYSLMNRELIFAKDVAFTKKSKNDREIYKYSLETAGSLCQQHWCLV